MEASPCKHQRFVTVHTHDTDSLGGPDAHTATGTEVLPRAGLLPSGPLFYATVGAGAGNLKSCVLVPVNQNVSESMLQHKVKKRISRGCMRPSVLVTALYDKSSGFGCFLEPFVVVGAAPAAILDTLLVVVVVDHLMEQSSGDRLDGTGQSPRPDVDLVAGSQLGDPGIFSQGKVPVSSGGGLDGDGGS